MENDHLVATTEESDAVQEAVREVNSLRPYLRDGILGMNDGLVSIMLMFITIVISDAELSSVNILVAGIACALAGSMSMALGEYLATKSQNQIYEAQDATMHARLIADPTWYRIRVRQQLATYGLDGALCTAVAEAMETKGIAYTAHFLKCGMVDEDRRHPVLAGMVSCVAFLLGTLPGVLPFSLSLKTDRALLASSVLCGFTLFWTGACKSVVIGAPTSLWKSAFENLVLSAIGAGLSYLVGLGLSMIG
jgi:VIT1/CCC1 family predicted Fe2+/Mn2+ transporter